MFVLASVVVVFYPPVAAIFLIMGLLLLWRGAYLDRKYGKDRPSRKEIDIMPVSEFKERSRDPRFTKWINHVYPRSREKPFNPDDF